MKSFSFAQTPKQASNIGTPIRRARVFLALAIFAGWAGLIAGRLFWVQIIRHQEWVARAELQQERTFQVAPRRGILYDRDLHELAMTVLVDSIYAVPGDIPKEQRAAEAQQLAAILHKYPEDHFTEAAAILKRIDDSRYFTWIARKQDPSVVAQVRALHLKGVFFQKEFKRFYPENDIAAQVLGYVGTDDNGLGGIEQRYNKALHGQSGRMLTALDARRHVLASSERDPEPGENMVLTIDANIQFMAEKALDHAMEAEKPITGTVVVEDPHTGQILALAIRPTFNPNDIRHTSPALLRDHAVSDVYEPGSAFKLVTYSAALDAGVTTPESKIDCEGGKIDVAGRIVHDDHYNGVLTTEQALAVSSDVAAIKLAEEMGKDRFYGYIHAYGFGQRTGIELPGETRGLLKPPQRWQPTTIGSVPMGHEIGVTPIQMVAMVSTIANGGTYLPPHIVLEQSDRMTGAGMKPDPFHAEDTLPDPLPAGAHRVITTKTAAEMRMLMENVIVNGTGKPARLNGYSAGGKTGTAQKIDPVTHTYSHTKHIASFVGFAPVNDPAIAIAVIMDSPAQGGSFGAEAAAPIFRELAQQILQYLGVPHDEPIETPKQMELATKPTVPEQEPQEIGDLNSLFAEVNDLPADDPLRKTVTTQSAAANTVDDQAAAAGSPAEAGSGASAPPPPKTPEPDAAAVEPAPPPSPVSPAGSVVVGAGNIPVPNLLGESVRAATEKAGALGLGVQVMGSGLARAQAPAAGTRVPAGTEIVVRFTR